VSWDGPSRLSFDHDLFRTTAYEGLSLRRRAELHGRVAVTLERRAGPAADESAALLSLHFYEAGEYATAFRYAVLAGHRAKQTLANVVAAELFDRALAAARERPEREPKELATVQESLGDVCEIFASYGRAGTAFAEALRLSTSPTVHARLLWKSGVIQERVGDYDGAIEHYAHALTVLSDADDDTREEIRVEVELATAGVRQRQGGFAEGGEWASLAAEHAGAADART